MKKVAIIIVAVLAAMVAIGALFGSDADSTDSKTTVTTITVNDSCDVLDLEHSKTSEKLADHIDSIYSTSYDAKAAQKKIQSDPKVAELQNKLRSLNDQMATCN